MFKKNTNTTQATKNRKSINVTKDGLVTAVVAVVAVDATAAALKFVGKRIIGAAAAHQTAKAISEAAENIDEELDELLADEEPETATEAATEDAEAEEAPASEEA